MKQWWRQKQTLSTEAKKVSIFTITFWFRGFIIGWEIVIGKCNLRFRPQGHVRFVSTLYTKLCRLWRVTRSVWNMLLSDHLWILDVHKRLRRANFRINDDIFVSWWPSWISLAGWRLGTGNTNDRSDYLRETRRMDSRVRRTTDRFTPALWETFPVH